MRWLPRVTTGLIAAVIVLGVTSSASAATAPIGSYPTFSGGAGAFDLAFSTPAALPTAQVTTDDTAAAVAQGKSAFLGSSTTFGSRFGSSRLQPYLTIGGLGLGVDSTTTITFASATTPGWGLALGDIDADYVTITATGPGGPLTPAQLGLGGGAAGVGNYCNNSPKPSTCGAGTATDVPLWCPDTVTSGCSGYAAATLVGNGPDTDGAYGWFVPTVPVTSVTLVYTPVIFFPSFQLWVVAPASAATVTGTVAIKDDAAATIPPGTSLALLDAAGAAVLDIEEEPVLVPVAADGSFSLVTELGTWQLDLRLPPGSTLTDPANMVFTAAGDVDLGVLAITDPNQLAATGVDPAPLGLAAVGLGALGLMLLRRGRAASSGL